MEEIKKMKNLESSTDEKNVLIRPEEQREAFLPFYKEEIHFINHQEYIIFIKAVENLVRRSDEYKEYIGTLKGKGLTRCSVFGNITDEMAPIEMHHGPIFTLFDYVEISLMDAFQRKLLVDSSSIAHQVLCDHFEGIIQTVMLSQMAHEAVHPKKSNVKAELIDIKSAHGNIIAYLDKYKKAISQQHLQKIRRYFKEYDERFETDDNFTTIFREKVKRWSF